MCGIAGLIDLRGELGPERMRAIARAMADAMPYRGPDDHGVWVSPDGRCALSHRRLSIIDTSAAGHQPFVAAGGRHVLTFNGEIFNYRELRQDLEGAGVAFRTASDTEVLLAMLERSGAAALEQLDGQFAFGMYDTAERALLLGRDPFGEKPLYWAEGDGWFAFASELHALRHVPGFDNRVDQDTVAEYLALQYVDAPRTIWRGASKLKPGHWLRLDGAGRVRIGRHFEFRPDGDVRSAVPLGELADELEEILLRLVRRRMISDVPLGAFLSGGVDSSTVVALMIQALGGRTKTFSIGFANAAQETEHLFARQMAEHLGAEHHERVLELDVLPLLHRIAGVLDEPNGDSSCLPTWLVSQVAREHVTVCLSGDGGDELFGGYSRYFLTLDQLAQNPDLDPGSVYYGPMMLVYTDPYLRELFGEVPQRTAALLESLRRRMAREPGPLLHRMRRHDAEHYLPGAVLAKVDRMSMQHSLEVRTPFLSRELAAFAARMPQDALYAKGHGKLVLKELAQRWIPREWLDRRKMGFGVPTLKGWGKDEMVGWLRELVLAPDARLADWIPAQGRAAFVGRMASEGGFSFYQAWLMLVLEKWMRAHECRVPEPELPPIALSRTLDGVAADTRPEDTVLWQQLCGSGEPVLVFCDEELPGWLRGLPAGSVLVAPEQIEAPNGLALDTAVLDWRGARAPDEQRLFALPAGTAVFLGPLRSAHPDVIGLLASRGAAVVHRVGDRWCTVDAAAVEAGLGGAARERLGLQDRAFAARLGGAGAAIEHVEGACWRAPLPAPLRAAAAARDARLVLFEDGRALARPGSGVRAIAQFGGGRFGTVGDWLYFSTSDGSDPRANGRVHRVVVRHPLRRGRLATLGAGPLRRVTTDVREGVGRLLARLPGDRTEFRLRPPFRYDGGECWLASMALMRLPPQALRSGARLELFEDGCPLPVPDCAHEDIRRLGRGRFSVWDRYVYFSSLDGSDPNRNGRDYTARLVRPDRPQLTSAAVAGWLGRDLVPAIRDEDEFERELRALLADPDAAPARKDADAPEHVALLIGALGPGGSERQLCNLAVELDRRGHRVTILTLAAVHGAAGHYRNLLAGTRVDCRSTHLADAQFAPDFAAIDPRRLRLLAALPPAFRDEVFRIYTHLESLRPDVLHCFLDGPNVSGGIAAALAAVPRAVLSVRSSSPVHFPTLNRPWFRRYYRALAASPRVRLCANTRAGGDDYARWLDLPAAAFTVVRNALDGGALAAPDAAAVAALREELGVAADAPVLAGVMRLSEEKQPLLFVRAVAAAARRVPAIQAVLVGTGPMADEVAAEVERLGLAGRLHLLGRRRDVPTVLGAAAVVLLTSRMEGAPNALLEAQWFGLPVVSTRVGGCPECLVEGETGLLCAEDPEQLGAACAALLADADRRTAMGRAGARFVRATFDLAAATAANLELYRGGAR
ncbi:MAG: asparagine synthase (glutamine-hydrolyzing) [Planctomycetota bacterium]